MNGDMNMPRLIQGIEKGVRPARAEGSEVELRSD